MRKLLVMLIVIGIAVSSGLVQAQPTQSEDCVQTQVQSSCLPNLSMETASPEPMGELKSHLECGEEANAQSGESCGCETLKLFHATLRQDLGNMRSVMNKNKRVEERYLDVIELWENEKGAYLMAIDRRLTGQRRLLARAMITLIDEYHFSALLSVLVASAEQRTLPDKLNGVEGNLNIASFFLEFCSDKYLDFVQAVLAESFFIMRDTTAVYDSKVYAELLKAEQHMGGAFSKYLELREMLGER